MVSIISIIISFQALGSCIIYVQKSNKFHLVMWLQEKIGNGSAPGLFNIIINVDQCGIWKMSRQLSLTHCIYSEKYWRFFSSLFNKFQFLRIFYHITTDFRQNKFTNFTACYPMEKFENLFWQKSVVKNSQKLKLI